MSANYPELEATRSNWRYQPATDCLKDRVILVTGASDGIGRTAARTFAVYGAHVLLVGRSRKKLENVFDWIEANTNTRPVIVPIDLANIDDESAGALYAATEKSYGRLDGILHNASLLGVKVPIGHYPSQEWQQVMAVNSFAPFLLTKTLLPLLDAQDRATVVLTSSSVGRQGRAYWGAYAVSKFAQEGLMETLADELTNTSQVIAASLNPGGTRTAMRAEAYPAEDPSTVPAPEEHMDLYLHLFADAPRALHGAKLDARTWVGPESN